MTWLKISLVPPGRSRDLEATLHFEVEGPDFGEPTDTTGNRAGLTIQAASLLRIAHVNRNQSELAANQLRLEILQSYHQNLKDTADEKKRLLRVARLLTIFSFTVVIVLVAIGVIGIILVDNTPVKVLAGMISGLLCALVSSLAFFLRATIMRQVADISARVDQGYNQVNKWAQQQDMMILQTNPEILEALDESSPERRFKQNT